MHTAWNDTAPIYRQLAQQLAGQLLDGEPPEGAPMPSVRQLAQQYLINPLTVSRALQRLVAEGFLEPRRGLGLVPLDRGVRLEGPLDDEQRAKLIEIAEKCPVHRTLTNQIDINTLLG